MIARRRPRFGAERMHQQLLARDWRINHKTGSSPVEARADASATKTASQAPFTRRECEQLYPSSCET